MNDTSKGVWTLKGKTLTVIFDSMSYPSQRYKTPLNFTIKQTRLYPISMFLNKNEYEKFRAEAEKSAKENNEIVRIPDYSTFQRRTNKTPRDFKGRYGIQYFKVVEKFTCDTNKNR